MHHILFGFGFESVIILHWFLPYTNGEHCHAVMAPMTECLLAPLTLFCGSSLSADAQTLILFSWSPAIWCHTDMKEVGIAYYFILHARNPVQVMN